MPTQSLPARPNILLILADDMGFSDLGCYGGEIATPHLDRLAAGGLRFTQTSNCARCCPSRAALLTGLYPHQAGVGHMVQDRGLPEYQGFIREDAATIAERLAAVGYLTGLSGKWHAGGFWPRAAGAVYTDADLRGNPRRLLPTERGFHRFYGNPAGGGSYFNPFPLVDQDRIVEPDPDFYGTDAYTDAAIRMMDEAGTADRPFFVHLCYNAPHWPLHARPEDIERHRGRYACGWDELRTRRYRRLRDEGILDPTWALSPRDEQAPSWADARNREWEAERMAVYAAQVDRMDQNIGRLVAHLEARRQLENTVIVFLADNGGSAEFLREDGRKEGERPLTLDGRPVRTGNIPDLAPGGPDTFMSYDLPWANASNTPFRRFKSWVHEGGIATPMILSWPAAALAPGLRHAPRHIIDLAMTLVELGRGPMGSKVAGRTAVHPEGESFADELRGQAWTRSAPMFFEHEGHAAVRDGDLKLVRVHTRHWELYRMDRDRTELNDLAATHAADRDRLAAAYADWAARCGVRPWDEIRTRDAGR